MSCVVSGQGAVVVFVVKESAESTVRLGSCPLHPIFGVIVADCNSQ